jgi:hypothetical protein
MFTVGLLCFLFLDVCFGYTLSLLLRSENRSHDKIFGKGTGVDAEELGDDASPFVCTRQGEKM